MSISLSHLKTPFLGLALSAAILGGQAIAYNPSVENNGGVPSVLHSTVEASGGDDTCSGWRSDAGFGPCAGPNG